MSKLSELNRRTLLASAGAGLIGSVAFTGNAFAENSAEMNSNQAMPPETHRFNLGCRRLVVERHLGQWW